MPVRATLIEGRPCPPVTELTPQQVAGQACLWCAAELVGDAVDLPPQRLQFGLTPAPWYPRRCPACVA